MTAERSSASAQAHQDSPVIEWRCAPHFQNTGLYLASDFYERFFSFRRDKPPDFVQTYFSLGDTEAYLKEHMVEGPVAHVRFPSLAAGATLEWKGQKFDFLREQTKREFAEQNKIPM